MTEEHQETQEHQETVVNHPVDGGMEMGENTEVATQDVAHQEPVSQNEINWKQANEALSQMKLEKERLAGELNAMKAYIGNSQQSQQQQKPKAFFEGRERDDYAQINDVESYVNSVIEAKSKEIASSFEQVQLQAKDPNYMKVIEKYQEHLSPALKQSIVNSPNPWQTAYEAVTSSAAYYRDQLASQQHPDAKRIVENSRKSKTLSGVAQASSLSEASRYESMSDDEIIALGNKYAGGY